MARLKVGQASWNSGDVLFFRNATHQHYPGLSGLQSPGKKIEFVIGVARVW